VNDDRALTLIKPFTDGVATFLLAASSTAECGHRSNTKPASLLDQATPAIDQAPGLATPELDAGLFSAEDNGAGKI
jgi:hypothetical protein